MPSHTATPAAAALERLRAENALLLRMLSEAQVSLRSLLERPYVPAERLAELTRARLDRIEY